MTDSRVQTNAKCDQIPPATVSDAQWLDAQAAATLIGVSKGYIYDACQTGGLRHTRLGGKRNLRIKSEWLDEWMQRNAQQIAA